MATHSSVLAWRIPWTEEPGGLQSTGSRELDKTEAPGMHVCIRPHWGGVSGFAAWLWNCSAWPGTSVAMCLMRWSSESVPGQGLLGPRVNVTW